MSYEVGPCPDCNGLGKTTALVNVAGRCESMSIGCRACAGDAVIGEERARALNEAEARRLDRIGRGLTLREEAERLGMTPYALSRMEHP